MQATEALTELSSCWFLNRALLHGVRSSSRSCYDRRREVWIQLMYSGLGGGGGGLEEKASYVDCLFTLADT
jgi:hypothetical protein